jgi:phage shock protein A
MGPCTGTLQWPPTRQVFFGQGAKRARGRSQQRSGAHIAGPEGRVARPALAGQAEEFEQWQSSSTSSATALSRPWWRGTAVVVAGPDRIGALATQAQNGICGVIDAQIEDPVALRQQMRKLAGQYPERIASVSRDLAELKSQQAQLRQESDVSDRVVELASADLEQIRGLIDRAELTQNASYTTGEAAIVRVVFGEESLDMKQAYGKARSIQQVQDAYVQRAADIQRDLGYISQQETRLTQLLDQLQQEHTDFQAQMWQMDRQVDTIARNDRLITMMEKRQRTLDDQGRYGADSIQQLSSRFADIRSRQEARLETLGQSSNINSLRGQGQAPARFAEGVPLDGDPQPGRRPQARGHRDHPA